MNMSAPPGLAGVARGVGMGAPNMPIRGPAPMRGPAPRGPPPQGMMQPPN